MELVEIKVKQTNEKEEVRTTILRTSELRLVFGPGNSWKIEQRFVVENVVLEGNLHNGLRLMRTKAIITDEEWRTLPKIRYRESDKYAKNS